MAKKNKSNDKIPADEMLLAEAIAAAEARGLVGCAGAAFKTASADYTENLRKAARCCAIGAIALAHGGERIGRNAYRYARDTFSAPRYRSLELTEEGVYGGNDGNYWEYEEDEDPDAGESLGWAFRNAMDPEL